VYPVGNLNAQPRPARERVVLVVWFPGASTREALDSLPLSRDRLNPITSLGHLLVSVFAELRLVQSHLFRKLSHFDGVNPSMILNMAYVNTNAHTEENTTAVTSFSRNVGSPYSKPFAPSD